MPRRTGCRRFTLGERRRNEDVRSARAQTDRTVRMTCAGKLVEAAPGQFAVTPPFRRKLLHSPARGDGYDALLRIVRRLVRATRFTVQLLRQDEFAHLL